MWTFRDLLCTSESLSTCTLFTLWQTDRLVWCWRKVKHAVALNQVLRVFLRMFIHMNIEDDNILRKCQELCISGLLTVLRKCKNLDSGSHRVSLPPSTSAAQPQELTGSCWMIQSVAVIPYWLNCCGNNTLITLWLQKVCTQENGR